jgi:hypothetical protein
MNAERIFELVWTVLNSPAVIAALAALVLWALNKLYAKRPAWQAYEGSIIAAVKCAEKEIPDDTPNKAMARLNAAMQYVLRVYEEVNHRRPNEAETADLREGVQIMHAELETTGTLAKAPHGQEAPA